MSEHLDGQFRYLEEASQRLGRKDWLNVLISTLMTLLSPSHSHPKKLRRYSEWPLACSNPCTRSSFSLLRNMFEWGQHQHRRCK